MTVEVNWLASQVEKLKRRLPMSFNFFTGSRLPGVSSKEVVFWEDKRLDVGKIAMRVGGRVYIFTSASAEVIDDSEPGDTIISGLDHGGLTSLVPIVGDLKDHHTHYVNLTPQTDARNTVTPAAGATNSIAAQFMGFLGFQGVENASWTHDNYRGLLLGNSSIPAYIASADNSAQMVLGVNSYLTSTLPVENNLVNTGRGAGHIWIISPDTVGGQEDSDINSSNSGADDRPYIRFTSRPSNDGGAGQLKTWANFEMREGNDRRGKFVFGGDWIGQSGQWDSTKTPTYSVNNFRVIISAVDHGNIPISASEIGGLFISSLAKITNNNGVPLWAEVSGDSTPPGGEVAADVAVCRFINDSTASDGKGNSHVNVEMRVSTQTVPWYFHELAFGSGAFGRTFATLRGMSASDTDVLRMRTKHYLWIETGGSSSSQECEGGIRMNDHYIFGVDSTDSNLVKLWSIASTGVIATASLPDTEQPKISAGSIDLDGSAFDQFLRSDESDNYTSGTLTFDSGTTISLADDVKILFGDTAGDGEMYWNASTLVIDPGTGGDGQLSVFAAMTIGGQLTFGFGTPTNVTAPFDTSATIQSTFQFKQPNGTSAIDLVLTNTLHSIDSSGSEFRISSQGDFSLIASSGDIILNCSGTINLLDNSVMLDNIKAIYGTGSDASLTWNTSSFEITCASGDMNLSTTTSGDINLTAASGAVKLLGLNMTLGAGGAGDPTITFDGATQDATLAYDDSANEFVVSGNGFNLPGLTSGPIDTTKIFFGSASLISELHFQGTGTLANSVLFKGASSSALTMAISATVSNFASTAALGFVSATGNGINFNDAGAADVDIRMESENDENMFFLKGSVDMLGLRTANPIATLDINGSFAANLTLIDDTDSPYTVLATDYTIFCDTDAGDVTVNLPAAASFPSRILNIKNTGTGTVTVDGNASETIDGDTTATIPVQYNSIPIQSDGTNWGVL